MGLKAYFSLETRNPIFINFRLSSEERLKVEKDLAQGFTLQPIRLLETDPEPYYWLTLNAYNIRYPRPELKSVSKSRLEVNIYVCDAKGRKGIYVVSPYVSKEMGGSILGKICDLAERLVMGIYGCGNLVPLEYAISNSNITFRIHKDGISADISSGWSGGDLVKMSRDYIIHNDISFFNRGRTRDRVLTDSRFSLGRFVSPPREAFEKWSCKTDYFNRRPDSVFFHIGEISYTVDALNR